MVTRYRISSRVYVRSTVDIACVPQFALGSFFGALRQPQDDTLLLFVPAANIKQAHNLKSIRVVRVIRGLKITAHLQPAQSPIKSRPYG